MASPRAASDYRYNDIAKCWMQVGIELMRICNVE